MKAVRRMLGHESAALTLDVYAEDLFEDLEEVLAAVTVLVRQRLCPDETENSG